MWLRLSPGTIALQLLSVYRREQWVSILATLGILIVLAAALNYQDQLIDITSSPGRWKLPKKATSEWQYLVDNTPVIIQDNLKIRQLGRLVLAKGESFEVTGTTDFTSFRYSVRARLNPEGVLEGRWSNSQSRNYYGTFQLVGLRSGDRFSGAWIGVSRSGIVRSGIWTWYIDSA
jgi:hypothetical protein